MQKFSSHSFTVYSDSLRCINATQYPLIRIHERFLVWSVYLYYKRVILYFFLKTIKKILLKSDLFLSIKNFCKHDILNKIMFPFSTFDITLGLLEFPTLEINQNYGLAILVFVRVLIQNENYANIGVYFRTFQSPLHIEKNNRAFFELSWLVAYTFLLYIHIRPNIYVHSNYMIMNKQTYHIPIYHVIP